MKKDNKNVCIYHSVAQMKISNKKSSKRKYKKKSKKKKKKWKMSKTKSFKQLGLKHLKSIHVTDDEIKWLQEDDSRLLALKYIEEELSHLIKHDSNKSKYRQPKSLVAKRKGATLGYIRAIVTGKSTSQLSVLKRNDKSKGNWKQYCSKIRKLAEGLGIMQLYNSPGFYNNLDCAVRITSKQQIGGGVSSKSGLLKLKPGVNKSEAINFTMKITNKSYVDEKHTVKNLKLHGFEDIGAFVSTIEMNSKYRGLQFQGGKVIMKRTPVNIVESIVDKILKEFAKITGIKNNDYVNWRIYDTNNDTPYFISSTTMKKWSTISTDSILKQVVNVLSSAETLTLDQETFRFEYVKFQTNAAHIKNRDNLCFLYGIYAGYLQHKYKNANIKDKETEKIIKTPYGMYLKDISRERSSTDYNKDKLDGRTPFKEARKFFDNYFGEGFCKKLNDNKGICIEQEQDLIRKLEDKLNCCIKIRKFVKPENFKTEKCVGEKYYPIVYPTNLEKQKIGDYTVYLISHEDHIEYVDNMFSRLTVNRTNDYQLCPSCEKITTKTHTCKFNLSNSACGDCRGNHRRDEEDILPENKRLCLGCHRRFTYGICMKLHKENGTCNSIKNCPKCLYRIDKKKIGDKLNPDDIENETLHICHHSWCGTCRCHKENHTPHSCYIRREPPHQFKYCDKIIAYDYEAFQDDKQKKQIPVCVIATKGEETISDTDEQEKYKFVTNEKYPGCYIFVSSWTTDEDGNEVFTDCSSLFNKWLLRIEHDKYLVLAHNAGKYDFHFIQNDINEHGYDVECEPLVKGNKYLQCVVRGKTEVQDKKKVKMKNWSITFGDSMNHIIASLSKIPKMYNIESISKEWCPYNWLKKENLYYKGILPDKYWFGYRRLDAKKQKQFDKDFTINVGTMVVRREDCCSEIEGIVGNLKPGCSPWCVSHIEDNKYTISNKYWDGEEKTVDSEEIGYYIDIWQTMIIDYCCMDVKILYRGIFAHKKKFMELQMNLLRTNQRKALEKRLNKKLEVCEGGLKDNSGTVYKFNTDLNLCYNAKQYKTAEKDIDKANEAAAKETKFEPEMLECRVIDPFSSVTNTSFVHKFFRYLGYNDKSLLNYQDIDTRICSKGELEYIAWKEHQLGRPLTRQKVLPFENVVTGGIVQCVRNENMLDEQGNVENKLKLKFVIADGFDEETNTVYAYHGCYFHGHNCKEWNDDRKLHYWRTLKQKDMLIKQGYKVEEMWECKWYSQKENDLELKLFLKDNPALIRRPYASLRESFSGGRTVVYQPKFVSTGTEKLAYIDITSEYPAVLSNCPMPFGKEKRIKPPQDFKLTLDNIDTMLGLNIKYGGCSAIYCKVKAPENLLIPLLPLTNKGKLSFPIGRFIRTWCSPEIKEALKLGYEILEIYEIIYWEESSSHLFDDFLRFGIENKIYASDFSKEEIPSVVEENKMGLMPFESYMDDWKMEKQGHFNFCCDLNPELFKFSGPTRQLLKLCINSFFGRFGMAGQQSKTEDFTKDEAGIGLKKMASFFQSADNKDINKFLNLKNKWQITYVDKDDEQMGNNTCLPVASFTTSYSRILLHRIMRQVGYENVVYSDTDSVIFRYNPNKSTVGNEIICKNGNKIILNSVLGGLTDELEGKGMITEFYALAPKTYSYEITTPLGKTKCKCKAKGYTLDNIVGKIINIDSMRYLINEGFNELMNTGEMKANVSKDAIDISELTLDASDEEKVEYEIDEDNKIKNIYLKKAFRIKINEQISVNKAKKIFHLNWLNDKRVIDAENSDNNHIVTKPVTVIMD